RGGRAAGRGRYGRQWILFTIVMLLSLAADQATKIWARDALPVKNVHGPNLPCTIPDDIVSGLCRGEPVTVVGGFWDWRLSMNPGSALRLFSGHNRAPVSLSP